jgi:DNA processing protein
MNIHAISIDDRTYPEYLRQIYDPPEVLYAMGNLELLDAMNLAIVGTRRATPYGQSQAHSFAKSLAGKGVCIVSGLAFGIDAAAHKGALDAGGATIAVLAQALPNIGPPRHRGLAREILENGGLILSEMAPGRVTRKVDYLFRNRIISGISKGVLIVEAGYRSGALNTARHAIDQNRDVMVLPGRITDESSVGTNKIMRAGAHVVLTPADVGDFLGIELMEKVVELDGMDALVFNVLGEKPMTAPELGEYFEGQLSELYEALGEMELKGLIARTSDLRYAVVQVRGR